MLMEEIEEEMEQMGEEFEEMEEKEKPMEEEIEEEVLKGPEGTVTEICLDIIKEGDWLAVVYDNHWWLAKAIDVDTELQDVKVEFLHPHGPGTNQYRAGGGAHDRAL
ncbi:hypothetical protein JZ751_028423 [Albula glossodonta]|uniref:Tudor domain-containing protein n=1 Tax=Albula glossodonta TaxID=121402 RepID=A0A8T2MPD0_9TELE|nr:hypothetical protein JZ751_028423 [Albula glossodonta]